MIEIYFLLFMLLSVVVLAGFTVKAIQVVRYKRTKLLNGLHLLTFGVFAAGFLMFLPVNFLRASVQEGSSGVSPFFVSLYNTLQVFFLNAEYHGMIHDLPLRGAIQFCFGFYFAILFGVSPLLTFANVLSLFKNLMGQLKIRILFRRPMYLFSELNERSITMAQSVSARKEASLIVFCDVMHDEEDEHTYELLQKAGELGAVIIKDDITRLHLNRKRRVDAFLIGENDSENIEQAIRLTEDYRAYANRSIYVFSSHTTAGYILDSVDKGDLLISQAAKDAIRRDPEAFIDHTERMQEGSLIADGFFLRRIDMNELMTRRILTDDTLLRTLFDSSNTERRISLMIVGLGGFGSSLLRNALWLYQIYGYRLTIDVIEAADPSAVEKRLCKDVPALSGYRVDDDLLHFRSDREGDCRYDIRIHCGVDCSAADLSGLLTANADSLRGTQAIFVTLGDDDLNIEAAVDLRRIFDRINGVNEKTIQNDRDELPLIYSVVYDDRKAANLTCGDGGGIANHRGTPFHIRFVGNMSDQYDYRMIEELKKTEEGALLSHFDWIRSTVLLHRIYDQAKDSKDRDLIAFRRLFDAYFDGREPDWYDGYLYRADGSIDPEAILGEVERYARYEYYRNSSIAKACHRRMIERWLTNYFDTTFDSARHRADLSVCGCDRCNCRRITEHMRWNAYMQSVGFVYAEKRADRAMLHNDLVTWDELDLPECYKD